MTENHKKAARKAMARDEVQRYALPVDIDPQEALIEELQRTAGWVAFLNEQVQELSSAESMRQQRGGAQGAIPEEVPHIWIQMLAQERAHLLAVAKTCVQVGIEERRVKIAEEQGQLMAQVISGLLEDLKVPITPEVKGFVRNRLTLLQGGQAAA